MLRKDILACHCKMIELAKDFGKKPYIKGYNMWSGFVNIYVILFFASHGYFNTKNYSDFLLFFYTVNEANFLVFHSITFGSN